MLWIFASVLFGTVAAAPRCQPDTLASVINDHDAAAPYVLVTASGRWLRAYGQDFVDPNQWHRRDPLQICAGPDSLSFRVRDVRRGEDLVTANDRATTATGPIQLMNGPGFRALLARVAEQCPTSQVRYATPAALLEVDERFESSLDSTLSKRLAAQEHLTPGGDYPACAGRDGASCPVNHAMDAIVSAGLMQRFATLVCAHGAAPWG